MSRFVRSLALVALLLTAFGPASARAGGAVSIAPLGLPAAKAARQEFKYALGKEWESAIAGEVTEALKGTRLFSEVVAEGGELTFSLDLREAKRTFDDHVAVSAKGTLRFSGSGTFAWSRGGSVVTEGSFDVAHEIRLDRQPWRSDLSAGWREIIRKAVLDAVARAGSAVPAEM